MSDWIEWHGGECPVAPGTKVQVTHRSGRVSSYHEAQHINWRHNQELRDITSYRIISHPETSNPVTSPAHYTAGEIECIDAIRAALTPEEFRGFCKGNVIKYTWRERRKGGNEDLNKAMKYLEWGQRK